MNRRSFLQAAGAGLAFPGVGHLVAAGVTSAGWRTFEVNTRVEILNPSGATRIWLPTALISETPFQKTLSNKFTAEGGAVKMVERKPDSAGIIAAEFPAGV